MADVDLVNVFTYRGEGGNPCPVVLRAEGMDAASMQDVARRYGHESSFVVPTARADDDFAFRFFVPNHEMEMCAHATLGTLWLLARDGRLPRSIVRIETRSGPVAGFVTRRADGSNAVEITQPVGRVTALSAEEERGVLATLGIGRDDLADRPCHNASTARVKTLVPLKSVDRLNRLAISAPAVEAVCRAIGSTGLYPYAVVDPPGRVFEARQFPRSSGYPEDAATGIAAAALAFGLLRDGTIEADDRPIRIFQGRAMGCLSEIQVELGFAGGRAIGCLLGGEVAEASHAGSMTGAAS